MTSAAARQRQQLPAHDPYASGFQPPHVHRDYDLNTGRLTAIKKDLEGTVQAVTTFDEFDKLDRPKKVVRPNGTTLTQSFDKYDRATSIRYSPAAGAAGVFGIVSTTNDYLDSDNRVTTTENKVLPDGTSPYPDVTTEQNNVGKDFTRTSNQLGTAISYTYNHNGKKQSISLPNGRGTTTYSYDDRGRLETVTIPGYSPIVYTYLEGQQSSSMSVTLPNGASTTYLYNGAQRISSITHSFPDQSKTEISYTYDRNGNPLTTTDVAKDANGVVTTDTTEFPKYDAIGRLHQFSQGGKTTVYTYEGYDRKTETVHTGNENGPEEKTRTYTYNRARRLKQVVEVAGGNTVTFAYEYDLNGNLVSRTNSANPDENMTFTYNARDELVQVRKGGTVVGEYDYDSQGRRIRQRGTDRGDVDSIYDDNSILEEALFKDGTTQRHRFHYGLTLLARLATGGVSAAEFYHQDQQRTTRHLSDASGAPVVGYRHDPWGNVREQSGDTSNRMTYTQQQYDPASGLYYYGARFYDPKVGRFLTEDTYQGDAFSPPSLNAYLYANSNPVRFIDPTGHEGEDAANPGQNFTPLKQKNSSQLSDSPVASHATSPNSGTAAIAYTPAASPQAKAIASGTSGDFASGAALGAEKQSTRNNDESVGGAGKLTCGNPSNPRCSHSSKPPLDYVGQAEPFRRMKFAGLRNYKANPEFWIVRYDWYRNDERIVSTDQFGKVLPESDKAVSERYEHLRDTGELQGSLDNFKVTLSLVKGASMSAALSDVVANPETYELDCFGQTALFQLQLQKARWEGSSEEFDERYAAFRVESSRKESEDPVVEIPGMAGVSTGQAAEFLRRLVNPLPGAYRRAVGFRACWAHGEDRKSERVAVWSQTEAVAA